MPKFSAGVLLYRATDGVAEVLIGHPGGPFWARKDDGAWSIPKGEYESDEDPWAAAQREFPRLDARHRIDPHSSKRMSIIPVTGIVTFSSGWNAPPASARCIRHCNAGCDFRCITTRR